MRSDLTHEIAVLRRKLFIKPQARREHIEAPSAPTPTLTPAPSGSCVLEVAQHTNNCHSCQTVERVLHSLFFAYLGGCDISCRQATAAEPKTCSGSSPSNANSDAAEEPSPENWLPAWVGRCGTSA